MSNEKIKVKNNENQIIYVTKKAWDAIYKDREGFSLFDEEATEKNKEVAENEVKAEKETEKAETEPKKVAKRGRPKKQGDSK